MNNDSLILIDQFCSYHEIDIAFITALHSFGLIEIIAIEDHQYLSPGQLADVEKMIRLHYELEINLEGIDAISHLLGRIETLQRQLVAAQNKLRLYSKE